MLISSPTTKNLAVYSLELLNSTCIPSFRSIRALVKYVLLFVLILTSYSVYFYYISTWLSDDESENKIFGVNNQTQNC